jgi:hypothetical protein
MEDLLGFIDGISVSVHPHYLASSLNTLAITLTPSFSKIHPFN